MKKLLLVSLLLIPSFASAQDYPPGSPPQYGYGGPPPGPGFYPHERFEDRKAAEIQDIDEKIHDLHRKRACVASAGDFGMLHACDNPVAIVAPPPPQNNTVIGVRIH